MSRFSGDIIVRLTPEASTRKRAEHLLGGDGASMFDEYKGTPLITAVPPEEIDEMERVAKDNLHSAGHSLNVYWRVDAEATDENARQLLTKLRRIPGVEHAYRELTASDPQAGGNPDLYQDKQTYLGSKYGIDAEYMWTQLDCKGQGVGVADVEEEWNLWHKDLPPTRPKLLAGDNLYTSGGYGGGHGTGVLGVLVAVHNGAGIAGIAPGASPLHVASRTSLPGHLREKAIRTDVANAVAAATRALCPGDVLLVEVQLGSGVPSEVEEANFKAIHTAVGNGVVVVEAAGNDGIDLATYVDEDPVTGARRRPFACGGDDCFSGAIIVGASYARDPYIRFNSNYGERIDCFAHGVDVVTTGGGDLGPEDAPDNEKYTAHFDGTSAAAAIIAGAALLVQARHKALHGTHLLPAQMRRILSCPGTGTLPGEPGDIGVMPNLRKIVEANPCLQDSAKQPCSW